MKITRTMGMISTANFKKAGVKAANFRPYADAIRRLTVEISRAEGGFEHPLLAPKTDSRSPEAVIVITSNRGLCGSYNSAVLALALAYIRQAGGGNLRLYVSGKKGATFFKHKGITPAHVFTNMHYLPAWRDIEGIAEEFMDMYMARHRIMDHVKGFAKPMAKIYSKIFASGDISRLTVFYQKFHSASVQKPEKLVLLPFSASSETAQGEGGVKSDFIFIPDAKDILEELIPFSFKANLYKCFLDAGASEQIARMRAMKSATSAAEKMIKFLTQQYNRARQTQITMELLDIIGGSRASKS